MNIDHIVLWVDNQQRSLAFFVDLLGMEPVRSDEFADRGQNRVEGAQGGCWRLRSVNAK